MKSKTNTGIRETIQGIVESVLSEESPDAMRVDWAVMKQQIDDKVRDFTMDMAQEILYQARKRMLKDIVMIINQHNMTDTTYGRLDAETLDALMDQLDEDGIQDLTMEAASNIEVALTEYAQDLGQFAVHVVSSRER